MKIENYLNVHYEFKFNEILNRTFIKEKENGGFRLLKEYKFNSIYRELKNEGIRTSVQELRSLLNSDFVPKFHPFKDYFNSLPEWDGCTDYIGLLAKTVETTNNQLFQWAFRKWVVGMISCAIDPEVTNQVMIILTGGQGVGKTSWIEKLVPKELGGYFFSGNINPSNKDTTLLMSEKLLINIDELASYNKKQVDAFKEMITKKTITERRAYGHFTEDYVRTSSFIGSANHNEILMDVTGNRRFLCFEALNINFEHDIDLSLVYSQGLALLNDDSFRHYFNKEDVLKIEKNNEQFIQSNEEVELINELFEIPKDMTNVSFMNATDVMLHIKEQGRVNHKMNIQEIGKIMKAKGFVRKKVKGVYKYKVKIKG